MPTPDALLAARGIVKKYIDLGVRFVVGKNVYAEWCKEDIATELERYAAEKVKAERERCLRVLKKNNDNDAHRYYIEHPEFFK